MLSDATTFIATYTCDECFLVLISKRTISDKYNSHEQKHFRVCNHLRFKFKPVPTDKTETKPTKYKFESHLYLRQHYYE